MRWSIVPLLLAGLSVSPNASADCVSGETNLERTLSAMLCRGFADMGIVQSSVQYKTRVLTVGIYLKEGPMLEAISDPNNTEVRGAIIDLIPKLEELVVEDEKQEPESVRFAVFSTEETSVRPRVLYARRAPGKKIEIVAVTDGIVNVPTPTPAPIRTK